MNERILLSLVTFFFFLLNDSTYEVSFIQVLACLTAVQFIFFVIIFHRHSVCEFREVFLFFTINKNEFFFRCFMIKKEREKKRKNIWKVCALIFAVEKNFLFFFWKGSRWALLCVLLTFSLLFDFTFRWCLCCYRLNLLHHTSHDRRRKTRSLKSHHLLVMFSLETNMMDWMFHWLLWRLDVKKQKLWVVTFFLLTKILYCALWIYEIFFVI